MKNEGESTKIRNGHYKKPSEKKKKGTVTNDPSG
jgi:hypothetical protein